MQTWIFQGNPDDFDIDGYLASRPPRLVWLASRYASDIAVGDHVYLWRNQGQQRAVAGIVAEAVVTEAPHLRGEDPDGVRFWRVADARSTTNQVRAVLRLVKVATKREVLRRDWFLEDPILKELPNLRMQAGTNYRVEQPQARRLEALWSRTGRDWSRNEAVAGLWAYAETYQGVVSRLPGSPVSRVALDIGRAVSGVYAKVMNFRSLDPRVAGQGMSAAGREDKAIWNEFYDDATSTLRMGLLRSEFARLWIDDDVSVPKPAEAKAKAAIIGLEAHRLEEQELSQLLAKYRAQRQSGTSHRPASRVLSARTYERDPLVIAIAKKRAGHNCEVSDCNHPIFETAPGLNYTEVHHIIPLADGGEDTIENVACLCAAHHREVHLGIEGARLTLQLRALRSVSISSAPFSSAHQS